MFSFLECYSLCLHRTLAFPRSLITYGCRKEALVELTQQPWGAPLIFLTWTDLASQRSVMYSDNLVSVYYNTEQTGKIYVCVCACLGPAGPDGYRWSKLPNWVWEETRKRPRHQDPWPYSHKEVDGNWTSSPYFLIIMVLYTPFQTACFLCVVSLQLHSSVQQEWMYCMTWLCWCGIAIL